MAQLIKASNESLVQEFTVTDATGSTPENVIIEINCMDFRSSCWKFQQNIFKREKPLAS